MNHSHTAHTLEEITLFGTTPADVLATYDAPMQEDAEGLTARMMDSIISLCTDTCNELDVQDLLWNMVNVFHRKAEKLERDIDTKMQSLQTLSGQQDGSETASYELEKETAIAHSLQKRLFGIEAMREAAAQYFTEMTGDAWVAKIGSRKSQGTITAGMYDAKQIQQQRNRDKAQTAMPEGVKVIVTGGDYKDYNRIYAYLDKLKANYDAKGQKLVVLHCANEKGVDKIVATWANNHKVAQVLYRPEWAKHYKAAPFKRNDAMLAELPAKTVIIKPDNGILQALIRESRKLGIPTETHE
jgi:hypothetical protein